MTIRDATSSSSSSSSSIDALIARAEQLLAAKLNPYIGFTVCQRCGDPDGRSRSWIHRGECVACLILDLLVLLQGQAPDQSKNVIEAACRYLERNYEGEPMMPEFVEALRTEAWGPILQGQAHPWHPKE